jgi:hypothetical protein
MMDWSPDDLDSLERAIVDGSRVQLTRRGTEYIVIPTSIRSSGSVDELIGTTSTGDRLKFPLPEIDDFAVFD